MNKVKKGLAAAAALVVGVLTLKALRNRGSEPDDDDALEE
jgi:hypothetical protein